jgi:hypothetical protein
MKRMMRDYVGRDAPGSFSAKADQGGNHRLLADKMWRCQHAPVAESSQVHVVVAGGAVYGSQSGYGLIVEVFVGRGWKAEAYDLFGVAPDARQGVAFEPHACERG